MFGAIRDRPSAAPLINADYGSVISSGSLCRCLLNTGGSIGSVVAALCGATSGLVAFTAKVVAPAARSMASMLPNKRILGIGYTQIRVPGTAAI